MDSLSFYCVSFLPPYPTEARMAQPCWPPVRLPHNTRAGVRNTYIPASQTSTGFARGRRLLALLLPLPSHYVVIRKVAAKNVKGAAYRQVYAPPAERAYLKERRNQQRRGECERNVKTNVDLASLPWKRKTTISESS